ncbi:MAG: YtxH domain-containing protein [Nitrospirales bacterium]
MDNGARCVMFGLVGFASGVLAGAAAGLLLAPHSGARTRRQLRSFVDNVVEDFGDRTNQLADEAKHTVGDVIGYGKRLVK